MVTIGIMEDKTWYTMQSINDFSFLCVQFMKVLTRQNHQKIGKKNDGSGVYYLQAQIVTLRKRNSPKSDSEP